LEEGGDETTMEREKARVRDVLTPGIMRACPKGKLDGYDVGATGGALRCPVATYLEEPRDPSST